MKNILLSICLLACAQVHAQWAPEAGWNTSTYSSAANQSGMKSGFRAGVTMNMVYFSDNFFLQPSLFYVLNRTSYFPVRYYQGFSEAEPIKIHTLEIPLSVMYKRSGNEEGNGIMVGAGIYLDVNIAEKYGNDATRFNGFKTLETGLQANIGYQFSGSWFARVRAQKSFYTLDKIAQSGPSLTSGYSITVGHYFYTRPEKPHFKTDK